jgi:hypothetical protein
LSKPFTESESRKSVAYFEEDRVHLLITNLAQWQGDGVGVPGCGRLWDEEKIAARDMQREWRSSFRIPAIGVDADITRQALASIEPVHRRALWAYHTSALTFEMQAREIMQMAKSTYSLRLTEAHPLFIEAFDRAREETQASVHAYAQSAQR